MIVPPDRPRPAVVARHYDELDAFYRALWGEDLHHGLWLRGDEDVAGATRNLTDLVAERGRIGAGDLVCDVGCGYGGAARHLAGRHGARVLGLTISEAQHRHALDRTGGTRDVRILHRDWLDNQLPTGHFDVVVAIECASHMPDKAAFLGECRRVLRPGGRLVLAAWLAADRPPRWAVRHLLEPICTEGRLAGLAAAWEYVGWMAAGDFRLDGFDDLSRGVARTWTVCLRRACRGLLLERKALRYLLDRGMTERMFLLTMARIRLAYRVGALRYGLFAATAT